MRRILLNPAAIFVIGATVGIASKFFDIYTIELRDIFSDITVYILIGVLISKYSETKKKAVRNVFLFFIAMLISYYTVAHLTDQSYSRSIALSWIGATFIISFLGAVVWLVNKEGKLSLILKIGISFACVASAVFFANDTPGGIILNAIIVITLIYHLWIRDKIKKKDKT